MSGFRRGRGDHLYCSKRTPRTSTVRLCARQATHQCGPLEGSRTMHRGGRQGHVPRRRGGTVALHRRQLQLISSVYNHQLRIVVPKTRVFAHLLDSAASRQLSAEYGPAVCQRILCCVWGRSSACSRSYSACFEDSATEYSASPPVHRSMSVSRPPGAIATPCPLVRATLR